MAFVLPGRTWDIVWELKEPILSEINKIIIEEGERGDYGDVWGLS